MGSVFFTVTFRTGRLGRTVRQVWGVTACFSLQVQRNLQRLLDEAAWLVTQLRVCSRSFQTSTGCVGNDAAGRDAGSPPQRTRVIVSVTVAAFPSQRPEGFLNSAGFVFWSHWFLPGFLYLHLIRSRLFALCWVYLSEHLLAQFGPSSFFFVCCFFFLRLTDTANRFLSDMIMTLTLISALNRNNFQLRSKTRQRHLSALFNCDHHSPFLPANKETASVSLCLWQTRAQLCVLFFQLPCLMRFLNWDHHDLIPLLRIISMWCTVHFRGYFVMRCCNLPFFPLSFWCALFFSVHLVYFYYG